MRGVVRWSGCLLLALACACSGGDGGGEDAGRRSLDSGTPVGLCTPGSGSVSLVGQWTVQGNLQVQIDERPGSLVNLCPNPQIQASDIFMKATLTDEGGQLGMQMQICDFSLPTAAGAAGRCPRDPADNLEIEIEPGPELLALLPTLRIDALDPTSPNLSVGDTFAPAPFGVVLGADLADDADPLPEFDPSIEGCTSAEAEPAMCVQNFELVTDDDGDGSPGVTIFARSGDETMVLDGRAFAVFRISPSLTGSVANDGCISGQLDAELAYTVVDSDVNLSGLPLTTAAVISNLPPFGILPTSTFKMLRADGDGLLDFDDDGDGDVTCAEISAHASTFRR